MKAKRETLINVPYSVRKEIATALSVSYPTIRKALNGRAETDLQKKIRHVALLKGGVEYEPIK